MTVVPCQNIGLGSTHALDSRYTRVRNVSSGPKRAAETPFPPVDAYRSVYIRILVA